MEILMKVLIATIFSLVFLTLGGCNTVDGFGRDVERTGEAIKDAAD